jgi:cyclin T
MFHSFARFPQKQMAQACLFLAAKTEDEWRKTEYVIRAANGCLHQAIDLKSEAYLKQANTLVSSEEILLQTLGFEVNVIHAHDILLKTCHLIHASKKLFQTAYFLATNCLHLTTFCLQYKPSLVACICIHLACQWSNLDIPKSSEGKEWYYYVDKNLTFEMLEECMQEFLNIMDKCPSKLKKLMENKSAGTKRPIQDEIPSETPPMKRQRLEHISPAATMAGSSFGGKVHVNRGLPIPNGHEQKLQSQQQSRTSMNVKACLKQKKSDHRNENVEPNENKYQQGFKAPNIPTKWETVPNIQFKMGISSNVNTNINHK